MRKCLGLLIESCDVRDAGMFLVGGGPVVELHLPDPRAGPCLKKNTSSAVVVPCTGIGIVGGIEQVVRHELEDQRDVDMHGASSFGRQPMMLGGLAKDGVLLIAFGGDTSWSSAITSRPRK